MNKCNMDCFNCPYDDCVIESETISPQLVYYHRTKNDPEKKAKRKAYIATKRAEYCRRTREWQAKNAERAKATRKIWEEKNKDKLKEYQKEYRHKNRLKINEYQKNYRLKRKNELNAKPSDDVVVTSNN